MVAVYMFTICFLVSLSAFLPSVSVFLLSSSTLFALALVYGCLERKILLSFSFCPTTEFFLNFFFPPRHFVVGLLPIC